MAWETVKTPIVVRAPERVPGLAASSAEALGVIAEKEFAAGRYDNARSLAAVSLSKAPFNAMALRVVGLAEAKAGRLDRADEMLTLAGNWSLRDDPSHAWLVERRLRQGSYTSAFAHADTLVRRREELYDPVFTLFTQAVIADPRAVPYLVDLIASRPPWRASYLDFLHRKADGHGVLLVLVTSLAGKPGAFNKAELENLYGQWLAERRLNAIKLVRARTSADSGSTMSDGTFELTEAERTPPFGWRLGQEAGLSVQIAPDDTAQGNNALNVYLQGSDAGVAADQLLLLDPGEYRLTGRYRVGSGAVHNRIEWRLRCVEGAPAKSSDTVFQASDANGWGKLSVQFGVPDSGCTAQYLELRVRDTDRRSQASLWIDNIEIKRASGRSREVVR